MAYRVHLSPLALREIDQFAVYLRQYSEGFAVEQIARLDRILATTLSESPLTWSYFPLTGAPYRAYLFRIGRRTQYWIVYTVDENQGSVEVLSFWNGARDPETIDL